MIKTNPLFLVFKNIVNCFTLIAGLTALIMLGACGSGGQQNGGLNGDPNDPDTSTPCHYL
jgi:hypothetical protein